MSPSRCQPNATSSEIVISLCDEEKGILSTELTAQ